VAGGDELLFVHSYLIRGLTKKTGAPYPKGAPTLTSGDWSAVGRAYRKRMLPIAKGAPFVTDKMLTNFLNIGLIRMALPDAKVIFVQRNLLDTAFSIYANYFEDHMHYFSDLRIMARHFRLVFDIMDFWQKIFPGFIKRVRYENIVQTPENEIRGLLDFCGLGWDPACLEFHHSTRPVFTTSFSQVREPLYSSSIGKWKDFAELLEPFRSGVLDLVDEAGFLKS